MTHATGKLKHTLEESRKSRKRHNHTALVYLFDSIKFIAPDKIAFSDLNGDNLSCLTSWIISLLHNIYLVNYIE